MRRARHVLLAVAPCACLLAATLRPAGAAPEEAPWSFALEVAPAADLSRMTVAMTFRGEVPKRLVLDDGAGAPWIAGAVAANVPGALVASPAGGYAVAGLAPGATLSYVVDLARLQHKDGGAYRVGCDLVTRIGRWLLRPAVLPEGSEATAKFVLPAGIRVATPWTPLGAAGGVGPYRVSPTTFRFWGWLALGRFEVDRFEAAGATVEVARLDGALAATPAGIRRWLTTAVETVAGLYGGMYPRRKLTAFIEPSRATGGPSGSGGSADPVSFGATWPGGGGMLVLHLPADTADARLPGEWVAIHELVHLAMPVVPEEDAWFSEGIATYYQEVLRMRSEHFPERDGWQSLADGFAYGASRPPGTTLLAASRTMHKTHAYSWTYWAGAALMLRLDAALRTRSGGAVGLDDAMRRFARLVGSERAYGADELSADAEAVTGRPGLVALAAPALASEKFPDFVPTCGALGIEFQDGRVRLDDQAPNAALRRAIASGARAPKPPAEPISPGLPR